MIIFHHDNSHGYLEVSANQLSDVGVSINDISGFSYYRWENTNPPTVMLFLEEDEDGSKFDVAFRERHGYGPCYHDVYTNGQSFIKSLERLDSARKRWELES